VEGQEHQLPKRAQRVLMPLLVLFASRGLCNSDSIMTESGVGVCGRGSCLEWPENRKSTRFSGTLSSEPDKNPGLDDVCAPHFGKD
jgi:hypothetical protein